ncbi:hypothetical protein F0562_013271 [Nyssa sinensis]|uniref:Uncharacterized protein n=1 Tax=Nyssa sinensis TaxID=561372 RepID=A0A5J4ZXE0_9ASTE|nr:hypothetical protein F0562_013271 [Nyssa sinensis]
MIPTSGGIIWLLLRQLLRLQMQRRRRNRKIEDELEDLRSGEESGGQRDGETDSMRRLEARLRTARLTRIKIKKVGEENMKPIKWVLEPKSQIGLADLAAINGFFST